MDYETFLNSYRILYEDYISQIDMAINKNVLKGDEIVNDYLSEARNGNYSLKSYKAKIIRNEQEHHQNDQDIEKKSQQEKLNLSKIALGYFDDYKLLDKSKYESPNRNKDLKIILQDLWREKQELQNKKTNLEKELIQLKKDYEIQSKTQEKNTKLAIKNLKNRFKTTFDSITNDTGNKYYSYEIKLLSSNDSNEIKELKTSISNIRKEGLEKKKILEMGICKEIDEDLINYINETENNKLNYLTINNQKKKEIIDIESRLSNIELTIKEKSKNYDFEQRKKYIQDYNECIYKLCERLNLHNEFLKKSFSEYDDYAKLFLFEILKINYNYLMYLFLENDEIEDLIYFVKEVISEIDNEKNKLIDLWSNTRKSFNEKKDALLNVLENYKGTDEQSTYEFTTNVITSIERFYDNLYVQIDMCYTEYFKFMMDACNKFLSEYGKIKNMEYKLLPAEYFNDYTEYNYGDVAAYGYKKLNNKSMIESGLANSLEEYYNRKLKNINYLKQRQIKISNVKRKEIDLKIKEANKDFLKIRKANLHKYDSECKKNAKEHKKITKKHNKDLNKRLYNNKKNTKLKAFSAEKSYKRMLKTLDN